MLSLVSLVISSLLLLPILALQCGGKKKGNKGPGQTTGPGASPAASAGGGGAGAATKSKTAPPSAPPEAPKAPAAAAGEPAKPDEGGDGNYEDVQLNPNNVPDAPK